MPPKIIAKNADRQGGVLPVSGAARAASTKTSAARLKLEIRRLPPGLTLTEFEDVLGEDWKLGKGKVDWREYRAGKARPPGSGKVPEQSRCYLHLINEADVKEFEKRFFEVVFQDKAGTHKNPELKHLQPVLDYAPNQRTPLQQARRRTDTRQGTIDQDPEFIAFLEAETQPIMKPAALDAERDLEKVEPKTTPLIEDLREKKANKAKAAQAKVEKAEKDKKEKAAKATNKDGNLTSEKDTVKATQQQKSEQVGKDVGKTTGKQATMKQQQETQARVASTAKSKKQQQSPKPQHAVPVLPAHGPPSPAPQRVPPSQRQRGNADGIKKMLQKDLGIRPKPAAIASSATSTSQASVPPAPPAQQPPTATLASKTVASKPLLTSARPADTKAPPLKAYLKHANPSQGMTEVLIQQALSQYGEVTNVTIDPRKGTAIAMFKQNDTLKKALEAKRVPVANGAVEVLEFRDRSSSGPPNRGVYRDGRRGRGGARGGAQSNATASAPPSAAI